MQDELSSLYHASYRRLVAQVFAFTTDLSEAQDAVQEAFARALARRRVLDDIDAPEAWLRTVAINIVRRRWRRKQLLNTIMLRERPLVRLVAEAPEPDRTDLREALATLPKQYREVIVLHYLADLPVDEVAAILEVPVGTVKSRLSRGRDALKGLLDDVEAPPMAQVRQRAGKIRTRQQATRAGAALAFLCMAIVAIYPNLNKPQLPADSPPLPPVFTAEGLTVIGISDVQGIPDVPGDIQRMEFHEGVGWLQTSTGVFARSTDGGKLWEITSRPDPGVFWPAWRPATLAWGDEFWAATRPTRAGVWWIAGRTLDGQWQLAHTTDPSRPTSWRTVNVANPAPDREFSAVLQNERVIFFSDAVYSLDTSDAPQRIGNLSEVKLHGHPVMLPNGSMIAAGGSNSRWLISRDLGVTWGEIDGPLPAVTRLQPTGSGYVAIGLYGSYTATSPDGVTWQKLPIR